MSKLKHATNTSPRSCMRCVLGHLMNPHSRRPSPYLNRSVLQEQDKYPSAKYSTFSATKRQKFTSYPKTKKILLGQVEFRNSTREPVSNKTGSPSLFQRATKTNVLGHHYFAPKRRETSQIKFKRKMAPTIASKTNLTLKTGAGSTPGARAGSPAAADRSTVAKRQKTAEGGTLRVSSNLDGRKRRVNPPRLATAKAGADGSPATAGANGSPGRNMAATTIPSDDNDENKPIEAAASTAPQKPRKGGRATIDDQPATNRKMAETWGSPERTTATSTKTTPSRFPTAWPTSGRP
jgi:hypothetical protein